MAEESVLEELTSELWSNEDALGYLEGRGLSLDIIAEAQLGYVSKGWFANSISIPYFDAQGRHRSTRYRRLEPIRKGRPKYDQLKGTKQHLYQVQNVLEPVVYVCEGEFDSLVLTQMGIPGTGIAGATNFPRPWRFLFRDCDLVLIVMDTDEEGRKASHRIAGWISSVTTVDVIELPKGIKDVTELYLSDPGHLRSLLEVDE